MSDGMNILLCGFNEAWVGPCKNSQPCDKHMDLVCVSCGATATHSCDSTGQFVCGAPLCDDCEHTLHENGTNGGIGFNAKPLPEGMRSHCRKGEQRHTHWAQRNKGEE